MENDVYFYTVASLRRRRRGIWCLMVCTFGTDKGRSAKKTRKQKERIINLQSTDETDGHTDENVSDDCTDDDD